MDYLRKQFDIFKYNIENGYSINDFAAVKVYTQKLFSENIAKLNNESYLEVGCGGSLSIHYLSMNDQVTCYGLDYDDLALEYSEYLKNQLNSKALILKGDAFLLPFEDNSIDCVFSIGMIEHYNKEDQAKLLKEMARVTRKNLIMGIPNYKEGSASFYIIQNGEEEHLECSLEELASTFPEKKTIFDGRGLFMAKQDVDRSEKYREFIINNYPHLYKETLLSHDIDTLILNEKEASPEVRRKHGFIEYFVTSM
ncbi:class I SAM-dependent methyltransferase [Rouxiella silvae]|uniref:class I SAM-dependent methyltransferase n=1 Tax=Rouxiella silvae TaxID=1646373 RepID=UPI0039EF1379